MAEVAVIGAGIAGLGSALALSRLGHTVTLLERDATPLPADPHAAFRWDRRGAPQVRHSHALLARLRNLLRDRYPDVLEALLGAGVSEIRFLDMMPPTIVDRTGRPGDEDLVALAGRRTTFEWVLRRSVLALDHVRLLDGVAVEGLTFAAPSPAPSGSARNPPTVTGVQVAHGMSHESLDADVVVVANGPRSDLPSWLAAAGVHLPERVEDTGIVYFSRFYQLHDGADLPAQAGPVAGDLGFLKYGVFLGDNRTFSVTLAAGSADAELRTSLLEADRFTAAARAVDATAPWIEERLAEPITPVHVMARLLNRQRQFLAAGEARVLGLHAVGDAHTCTNPLYGRGCSLAMVQASLLADALATHPDNPAARSVAYERLNAHEVEPWYRAAIAQDRASKRAAERGSADVPVADEDPATAIMRDGVLPAIRLDPEVYRAFLRMFNLLTPPDTLMTDPDLMARVLAVYHARDEREAEPPVTPGRETVLEAMRAP